MKLLFCLTVFLATPFLLQAQVKPETTQIPDAVFSKTVSINKDFLVYKPKNYSSEKALPLMIFLHGMGERGNDILKAKKHGPSKEAESKKDFPFILIVPQCLKDTKAGKGKGWWKPNDLELLLTHVKKTYKVDEKRIYLTGLSMGGFGSWAWAAKSPQHFAAVAPICGGGNPKTAKSLKKLPIWVFHGDKDSAVNISKSQVMVDALKKIDGNVKFTIYPGVKHDSWTQTYANPELYTWFLSHSKK
ncbi:MAG: prolyl oligopeptidase family serine peptidase [Lentisphaeraceae bacterium]|nr:prolyl oligopeptidase family serine peptidase [Lentisphaeraceae bacterium]